MKSRQGRLLQATVLGVLLCRAIYFLYFAMPHDWQRSEFNLVAGIYFAVALFTFRTVGIRGPYSKAAFTWSGVIKLELAVIFMWFCLAAQLVSLCRSLYFLYFAMPHDWQRSEFDLVAAICFALVSKTNLALWKKYRPRDSEIQEFERQES